MNRILTELTLCILLLAVIWLCAWLCTIILPPWAILPMILTGMAAIWLIFGLFESKPRP